MRVFSSLSIASFVALPFLWLAVATWLEFSLEIDFTDAIQTGMPRQAVAPSNFDVSARQDFQRYFTKSEITPFRKVYIDIELPFADLLKPGEQMPVEPLRDLYASLRAGRALAPFCDEVLVILATTCAVERFEGRVRSFDLSEREAIARLTGQLLYIPRFELGHPEFVINTKAVAVKVNTNLLAAGQLANTPESRGALFAQAVSICADVRERFGNCVIGAIQLGPFSWTDGTAPDHSQEDSGAVSFVVVVDTMRHTDRSVENEVNRLVSQRLSSREKTATPSLSNSER